MAGAVLWILLLQAPFAVGAAPGETAQEGSPAGVGPSPETRRSGDPGAPRAAATTPLTGDLVLGTPEKRPNVLLLTVDTLRADHLGAYGYPIPTSPAFDRLAAEGVLFLDAITPVPTTAPALASMLTGRHADGHGVTENFGHLPSHLPSLARTFQEAGYRTAGFYGNGALQNGFGAGFETFEPFGRSWLTTDRQGAQRIASRLRSLAEPWFVWVHFFDPHGPYNSSPPDRSANFAYPEDSGLDRVLKLSTVNGVFGEIPRYQQLGGRTRLGDYVRLYDGVIAGTDDAIATLRSVLEEIDALDDTLVVITADHGEALGEDDYFFQHGTLLHPPGVHIPLLLRHPDLPAGLRTAAPASLVDLYPTIVGLVGLEAPPGLVGTDLRPALRDSADEAERTRFAYTVTPSRSTSIRRGRWELRGAPGENGAIDDFESLELFDHAASPPLPIARGEKRAIRVSLLPDLRAAARRLREPDPTAAPLPAGRGPTAEETERLRALGYID